jgi:hypothetical protein
MRLLILLAVFALTAPVRAEQVHRCSADAVKRAEALLRFHVGLTENVSVENAVRVLAPVRNPANAGQSFDVLEVQGYVYRATYRMRLIYAQMPDSCVLMGQEILEHSSL